MSSRIDVDEIRSKTTNGNLTIQPNGTGLIVPKRPVAFSVEASDTDQSIGNTSTKVEWETVVLDTGSYWDSTNHRYTPQVAGFYMFGGTIRFNVSSVMKYCNSSIFKNGTREFQNQIQVQNDEINNGNILIPTCMVQLNGSTDYVEAFAQFDHTTTVHDSSTNKSVFFGVLIHAT